MPIITLLYPILADGRRPERFNIWFREAITYCSSTEESTWMTSDLSTESCKLRELPLSLITICLNLKTLILSILKVDAKILIPNLHPHKANTSCYNSDIYCKQYTNTFKSHFEIKLSYKLGVCSALHILPTSQNRQQALGIFLTSAYNHH